MCLIAFAFQTQPDVPLIVIANRDEFYSRPTMPMQWWPSKDILAGKDLQAGGTWLGLSRNGRFAAVTNLRSATLKNNAVSRGSLVTDFLFSYKSAKKWIKTIISSAKNYMGFNLLLYDGNELLLVNSENGIAKLMRPGVYAFSNADPDTTWPKVKHARESLTEYLASSEDSKVQLEELSILLSSRKTFDDQHGSEPGFLPEQEKLLSSPFIVSDEYGTRSCTAVIASGEKISVMENCYQRGVLAQTTKFSYTLSETCGNLRSNSE